MSTSPRVAIVVQARLDSTRLPGKAMLPLAGAPAVGRMLERVRRVRGAEWLVLATSDRAGDDPLAELGRDLGVTVARGPRDDVLARFVRAAPPECDAVVRLTGDCPLVDPDLVDRHIEVFARQRPRADYVSNAVVRTWPDGLDVEVVTRDALLEAHRRATSAADREHVTPWVRRHARTVAVTQEHDLSALRWTLDTARDYEVLAEICELLQPRDPAFGTREILRLLLERPDLIHTERTGPMSARERAAWTARIAAALDAPGDGA